MAGNHAFRPPIDAIRSRPLILFENFAAVEMTVEVEVVVDRSMNGSEFLQGLHVPEFGHCAFPSSERLV
jgi:hypothetical protein